MQNGKIRSKLVALAREDLGRGDLQTARRRFVRLCGLEPHNPAHLIKLGELHDRLACPAEAVTAWTRAAALFEADAFDLKAVALYKRALALEPGRMDVSIALSETLRRLDRVPEALAVLQASREALENAGRLGDALDVRLRIAELEPWNAVARFALARDLDEAGHAIAAIAEYADVIVELARTGAPERIPSVYERLYGLKPDAPFDSEALSGMVDRADVASVRSRIAEVLGKHPDDDAVDEALERLMLERAWGEAIGRVYEQVGRLHREWCERGSSA